jgi:hypothetical protein
MFAAMRIKKDELRVGHWIQFCTQQGLVSKRQQRTYSPTQHFLVISQQEPCRYYLIDIKKKVHHYIVSANTLHRIKLASDVEIRVLTRAIVELIHGNAKVQAVYGAGARYIQAHSSYFAQAPTQLLFPLPPSDPKPPIQSKEEQMKNQDAALCMALAAGGMCIIC